MKLLKLLLKLKPVKAPAPSTDFMAAHAAAQDAGVFNPWNRRA